MLPYLYKSAVTCNAARSALSGLIVVADPVTSSGTSTFAFLKRWHGGGKHANAKPSSSAPQKTLGIENVAHIVAVSSAKGGVGKSTTAVNVAVAMAVALKMRVGLLDADIHGPSIAKMMKLSGKPAVMEEEPYYMRAKENHGVKVMSMGFFLEVRESVAWRGPMVNNAFDKLLLGTGWGDLDCLIVDMPPGTGDAQINLGQRIPLSGAVVVSTPQDIALLDALRGVDMFNKLRVPVLGMVENMSVFKCSKCGHEEHIFGHGGVDAAANDLGIKVLGHIPLVTLIRERADQGAPVVVADPTSSVAQAYIETTANLVEVLSTQRTSDAAPSIAVE